MDCISSYVDESSFAKKITALAMSIGIPSLLIGILDIIFSLCSSVRLLVIAEETN